MSSAIGGRRSQTIGHHGYGGTRLGALFGVDSVDVVLPGCREASCSARPALADGSAVGGPGRTALSLNHNSEPRLLSWKEGDL